MISIVRLIKEGIKWVGRTQLSTAVLVLVMVDVRGGVRAEHALNVTVKAVNYATTLGNAPHAEAQRFVQVVEERDGLF